MKPVKAGIVVTGTEVLTGRIVDRNGPWISERLAELGVEVAHITVVGDRPEDLEAALRFMAVEGMDLIVTSGGLGPTADDLTAEIVARFAGVELVLDEEMEEKIAAILRRFARRFSFDEDAVRAANRKQAMVPEGSLPLDPVGTAPGLVVPADGRVVIVLPGPPRELQPMWPRAIESRPVQAILARATPLLAYTVRMFGIPESEIAKSLREIERGGGASGLSRPPHPPHLQSRRRDDRCPAGAASAGAQARGRRVLLGRAAGGADHRSPGRFRLFRRRRRPLLERGQD